MKAKLNSNLQFTLRLINPLNSMQTALTEIVNKLISNLSPMQLEIVGEWDTLSDAGQFFGSTLSAKINSRYALFSSLPSNMELSNLKAKEYTITTTGDNTITKTGSIVDVTVDDNTHTENITSSGNTDNNVVGEISPINAVIDSIDTPHSKNKSSVQSSGNQRIVKEVGGTGRDTKTLDTIDTHDYNDTKTYAPTPEMELKYLEWIRDFPEVVGMIKHWILELTEEYTTVY